MKKSAAVLAVLAMAVTASAQTSAPNNVKDDLFRGTEIFAKGASDVTEITMDPDTLGLVGGKAHNMVLNVVRTYEYDKPGMYNIADVEAFRNKLMTGDWHCSVHTQSVKRGESTDICEKHRTDDLKESAIITVEPKELTFIHTIRKRGTGESEMEEMLMLPGMGNMPVMAMVAPDLPLLKLQMNHLKDMPRLPEMKSLDNSKKLRFQAQIFTDKGDNVEIGKNPDEVQKEIKGDFTPELEQELRDAAKSGGMILQLKRGDTKPEDMPKVFKLAVPAPALLPDAKPAPEATPEAAPASAPAAEGTK